MNQKAGGRGQTKGKATIINVCKAKPQGQKLHSKGTTMHACGDYPPTGQQQISQLTLIIDNLINQTQL